MDSKTKEAVDLEIRRQKRGHLLKLAEEQDVIASENVENLYSKSETEGFDVDEFLEFVREIRQNGNSNERTDELMNGK